jgi:hypothetical protein
MKVTSKILVGLCTIIIVSSAASAQEKEKKN